MSESPSFFSSHSKYSLFRRNIMSPLNWFFSIMSTVFFYGFVNSTEPWVKIFSAGLISVFVLFYLVVYVYNLVKHPNRLQTEGSNLEEKALNCLLPNSPREVLIRAEPANEPLVKN